MKDSEGNKYKWFCSYVSNDFKKGNVLKLKGTVKAHEEYQGCKNTALTRCKILEVTIDEKVG